MPMQSKGCRLWFRKGKGVRKGVWIIREGNRFTSTGFGEGEREQADVALRIYLERTSNVSRKYVRAKLASARLRAKARGRSFDLTLDQVLAMAEAQDWRCALTRLPFDLDLGDRWNRPFSMAIDRKDSTKGYTIDNVRLILHAMNMALGPWGDETFAAIAACFLRVRAQPN